MTGTTVLTSLGVEGLDIAHGGFPVGEIVQIASPLYIRQRILGLMSAQYGSSMVIGNFERSGPSDNFSSIDLTALEPEDALTLISEHLAKAPPIFVIKGATGFNQHWVLALPKLRALAQKSKTLLLFLTDELLSIGHSLSFYSMVRISIDEARRTHILKSRVSTFQGLQFQLSSDLKAAQAAHGLA